MLSYLGPSLILFSLFILLLPKKRAKNGPEEKMGISVIIPVYNGGETIEKCLESVLNTKYKNLEIIVVNDGSIDETKEKVKKFQRFGVLLLNQKNMGKFAALNNGFLIAKNPIIFTLDSDTFIKESCFSEIVKLFEDRVGAVVIKQVVENKNLLTKMQDIEYAISSLTYRIQDRFGRFVLIAGSAMAISREAWLSNNGFRNRITDEADFLIRLMGKKWKIIYLDSSFVKTVLPSRIDRWFSQRIRWKKGQIENLLSHWRFFLKNIHLFFLTQPQIIFIITYISFLVTTSFWTQGTLNIRQNYLLFNILPALFKSPKIAISFFEGVIYSGIFNFLTKNLITGIIISSLFLFFLKINKAKISFPEILFFYFLYFPFLALISIVGYILAIKDLLLFGHMRRNTF